MAPIQLALVAANLLLLNLCITAASLILSVRKPSAPDTYIVYDPLTNITYLIRHANSHKPQHLQLYDGDPEPVLSIINRLCSKHVTTSEQMFLVMDLFAKLTDYGWDAESIKRALLHYPTITEDMLQ